MRVLVWKELRELALPALMILVCAVVVAGADVVYNRQVQYYEPIGVFIWAVLSLIFAFLGGGGAIARESRGSMVFLTCWPYSRFTLWLSKALTSAVVTGVFIALGFAFCLAAARLKLPWDAAGQIWLNLPPGTPYILLACFAFGLLWSGLVASTPGAATLGLVTAAASFFLSYAYVMVLHLGWTPYVGHFGFSETFLRSTALTGCTLALIAAAAGFVSLPLFETRRRVLRSLAVFGMLLVLLAMVFTAWEVTDRHPSLLQPIRYAALTADGTQITFTTQATGNDPGGVWLLPVTGGNPRLIAKGAPPFLTCQGNSLGLPYQGNTTTMATMNWTANSVTGKLRAMGSGEPTAVSPDGRFSVLDTPRGLVLKYSRFGGIKLPATTARTTWPVVFSPDSRYLYYTVPNNEVVQLDLTTQQQRVITTTSAPADPTAISPDGRWLAASHYSLKSRSMLLIDTNTGQTHRFPDLIPRPGSFIDSRYLWAANFPREPAKRGFSFVDLRTARITHVIPEQQLGGELWVVLYRPGLSYCVLEVARSAAGAFGHGAAVPDLYLVEPDGSHLRPVVKNASRDLAGSWPLGLAPDGNIIIRNRGTFLSLNPVTGKQHVIASFPSSQPRR